MSNSKLFGLVGVDKLENVPTTLREQRKVASDIQTDMTEVLDAYPEKGLVAAPLLMGLGYFLSSMAHAHSVKAHPAMAKDENNPVRKQVEYEIDSFGLFLQESLGEFAMGIDEASTKPLHRMDHNFKVLCASVGLTQEKLDAHKAHKERVRKTISEMESRN